MKLYNIAKSLILEVASIDSIVDAIKKKDKIIIYYDGDEPGGRGLREIEPVCFGYSKSDNPVLRAWDSSIRYYLLDHLAKNLTMLNPVTIWPEIKEWLML